MCWSWRFIVIVIIFFSVLVFFAIMVWVVRVMVRVRVRVRVLCVLVFKIRCLPSPQSLPSFLVSCLVIMSYLVSHVFSVLLGSVVFLVIRVRL